MAEAGPRVEVRGLRVGEARDPVLDGIELTVGTGSIHVLVGPNGGGKTTLLRAILGEVAFRGSIRVAAGDGIGYVPQVGRLPGELPMTATELLALELQARPVWWGVGGAAAAAAGKALAAVGLAELGDRPLAEMSGGELQRVLLARALLGEPGLLLLDEPERALDPAGRELLRGLLGAARARGAGVLLVTHDPAGIRDLADVATRVDRTVRATGPAAQVLA